MTEREWLKMVCDRAEMSDKDIVKYGIWYVNRDGDLFGNPSDDMDPFNKDSYNIYSYQLHHSKQNFEDSLMYWHGNLSEKKWVIRYSSRISRETYNIQFAMAFALAWMRSNESKEITWAKSHTLIYEGVLKGGTPCVAMETDVDPQALGRDDSLMILEYSAEQRQFHYNYIKDGIANCSAALDWYPIATTSVRLACLFTSLMKARMYNGAVYTYDQMKAEWNYFLFVYYRLLNDFSAYGLPERESSEVMVKVEKNINWFDGHYAENEQMKLRSIGVPGIYKTEDYLTGV